MSDEPILFSMLDSLGKPSPQNRPASTWGELLSYGQGNSLGENALGLTASSQPNVFGGQNWQVNGHYAGYSTPNPFGGVNHHAPDGTTSYSTQPNVFGGFNIHQDGQMVGWTAPNAFGGSNVHNQMGQIVESSSPSAHGVDWRGQVPAHSRPNVFGGTDIDFDPSVTL